MLNFIVSAVLAVIALYLSYQIIKKSVGVAISIFPSPHKVVVPYEIFYSIAILILFCGTAYLIVRPGSMVNNSLATVEERLIHTNWKTLTSDPIDLLSAQYTKRQQQFRNLEIRSRIEHLGWNIAISIGVYWNRLVQFGADTLQASGNFVTQIIQSFTQNPTIAPVNDRSNFKLTTPVSFTCIANPGGQYNSVFLREAPSWSSATDSHIVAKRGTEIKFTGKLENQEGVWFVINSETDVRRYVNMAICSTSTDLNMIPTISPDN